MGIFFPSPEEDAIREHNQGQKDGSQASGLDHLVHSLDVWSSEAYDKGWKNGVENPASDDDDD